MSTSRPMLQTWFTVFVAVTGVISLLPYRERALMPAPSGTDQGLLAQQIETEGSDNLVNDTIAPPGQRLAGTAAGSPGARRLIAQGFRPGEVPGTNTLSSTVSDLLPPAGGSDSGSGAGATGGTGGDAVNLAGGGGSGGGSGVGGGGGLGTGASPLSAPQGPAVLSGAASELLASVGPEPSTWLLFISGLMVMGQALRKGVRRGRLSLPQRS